LAWQTTLHLMVSQDRLSTRGLLEYEDDTFGRRLLPCPNDKSSRLMIA